MKYEKIPESVITRLSYYLRQLESLEEKGIQKISSNEFSKRIGINSAQLRKDLSYFGDFGKRGSGYEVNKLKKIISNLLGIEKQWNVAIAGAGNLGQALVSYPGFEMEGFKIKAVFDNDIRKIGWEIEGVTVYDVERMAEIIKEKEIEIGIITVPSYAAQEIADIFIACDIKAILNFASTKIIAPSDVKIKNVDLSIELESLSFYLYNKL